MALSFHRARRDAAQSALATALLLLAVVVADSQMAQTGDNRTNTRTRRGATEWIRAALTNICPWAECMGVFGCTTRTRCSRDPDNFRTLKRQRGQSRTCYAYETKDCAEGPKEDECACITDTKILQLSYRSQGDPLSDDDIRTLCLYKGMTYFQESVCPTSASPTPPIRTNAMGVTPPRDITTNRETKSWSTALRTKPMHTPSGPLKRTAAATDPPAAATDATAAATTAGVTQGGVIVSPADKVDIFIQFWLPALFGIILIILLVALCRRRRTARRGTPARVKIPVDISADSVRYTSNNAPRSPSVTSNSGVSVLSNPSYEQHISGNELERGADFFCPRMESTRNNLPCAAGAKGRQVVPGEPGAIHGNPPVLLGNHNAAFSEGNYLDVSLDLGGADEWTPVQDREAVRGSRYDPHSPKQINTQKSNNAKSVNQHSNTGYENPDDVVSQRTKCSPTQKPGNIGHNYETCGQQGPPSDSLSSSREGALDVFAYEVAEISSKVARRREASGDAGTSFEVAAIDAPGAVPRYAKVNKGRDAAPLSNGTPKAGCGYEVATISPSVSPTGSTSSPRYDYAMPSGAYPPGKLVAVNKYNVLQTSCKEKDGEYSMLKRSQGGGDCAGHVPPIFMSVNQYNRIDLNANK